jgi:hypothetical protein
MTDIHLLGTHQDMEQRVSGHRVDNAARRALVEEARQFIYERRLAVDNADRIEKILRPDSLIPTTVSCSLQTHAYY